MVEGEFEGSVQGRENPSENDGEKPVVFEAHVKTRPCIRVMNTGIPETPSKS
jgi:hypothetical protein